MKFKYGDEVIITKGFYKGREGTIDIENSFLWPFMPRSYRVTMDIGTIWESSFCLRLK